MNEIAPIQSLTLEPYQRKAVDWLRYTKRGIVVASAGSGKTIIAAAALQLVILSRHRHCMVRVGWMANTIEQCQQAREALASFPCGPELRECRIECAAADTDWSDRDVLVTDECHHSPAPQWLKQVQSCGGARWGFTATPFSEDTDRNEVLLKLFDSNICVISREEVANRLAPAKVIMLDATDPGLQKPIDDEIEKTVKWRMKYWKGEEWKLKAIVAWQVGIKRAIVNNSARNTAAVSRANHHFQDHVLMLVNEIDHGQSLCDQINGAVLCHSKMGKKARREAIEAFKAGTIRCIVATSLADEGLDLPIANVLILVSGGRSSAKTEQRTGRVLRAFAGKPHGLIYDFTDRGHTMMANHAKKRMATYRKLGYSVDSA